MNTVIKGVIATANFSIQSLYYELVWPKKNLQKTKSKLSGTR